MALFKCKMCGGDLEISSNESVATCEYCGTQQTLPKLDDDRRANLYDLYDRANHFRRNNEFDKAAGIYEQILNESSDDSEAYWSLVLCRYGIEYVEDPETHKRVPTVNRAQFTSIFDDVNYKSALEYADVLQRHIYEEEAKSINEIQKGILEISQKEEPFDVFICYKETDNSGRRTPDSVLAQDLYYQLGQEGFKVFFSRITLEDKIGSAYEPYIFAALNSAKVMVVIGTKPEFFNAAWVKNEWSRYLALIRNGAQKMLIPAYKDMDPYDLPEEFSHLQAQDMGKLGFMQDLIRGIKKIVGGGESKPTPARAPTVVTGSGSVAPLLKRAFMFLEDEEWESADEYCEKVLDIEPENAMAYLGKLMADLCVRKQEELRDCEEPFDDDSNYQKAMRFGDDALKTALTGYIEHINTRNETARLEGIYNEAKQMMDTALQEGVYVAAANMFDSISNYKDSAELAKTCRDKYSACVYDRAKKMMDAATHESAYIGAAAVFDTIGEYMDAVQLARVCREKAEESRKVSIFAKAEASMNRYDYAGALRLFESIPGWHNADEKAAECKAKIEEQKAKDEADRLERERKEEAARQAAKKRAKFLKRLAIIASIIACAAIAFIIILNTVIIPNGKYNDATELADRGESGAAAMAFGSIGEYKDSKERSAELWDTVAVRNVISAGSSHTVGLKADGTVIAVGSNEYDQCDVSDWTDIVAISAGYYHTVGLKSDGTVVTVGSNGYGQRNVSDWTDIVAISAGYYHTVGLKSDGTVVVVGDNDYGQCDVSDWTDIVAISAGYYHTVGLKSDGTVVAVGGNDYGPCDVFDWTDIAAISAGSDRTVGLKSDGSAVAVGSSYGRYGVSDWTDIVAIFAGCYHTVGLKSDGTVVAVGSNGYGQRNVSDWTDIVAISAGSSHTVGLKSDGTVVAVGDNNSGQCDVSDWRDIKLPNK